MKSNMIPCINSDCSGESSQCADCPINQKGLCEVFRIFAKKYLTFSSSEIDRQIVEKTVESIFKRLPSFRGREGYMEGAFYRFCEQEYYNRRADVLRSKKKKLNFEDKIIIREASLGEGQDIENSEFSLADMADYPKSDRKWNSRYFTQKEENIADEIEDILEQMALEEEPCAKDILVWLEYARKGYTKKEQAKLKGVSYDTFRQTLSRCFRRLKSEIIERLT